MMALIAAASTTNSNPLTLFLPLVLMGGVFYFLLIRPQQKRVRAQQALVNAVEVGDEIMTTGGIFGTVVEIDDDEGTVLVEIAPGHPDPHGEVRHLASPHRGRRRLRARGRRPGPGPAVLVTQPSTPGEPGSGPVPEPPAASVTLTDVQTDPELSLFISSADRVMEGMGYTEHGFRHANLVASISYQVLHRLGYTEREANLAAVAGYLHDVGNMLTREAHAQTGALLVHQALKDRAAGNDLAAIMAAVANHEEDHGYAVSPISAAVILADKSDVHRSRVRRSGQVDVDIHDRVNSAVEQSFLRVDSEARTVTLELTIDTGMSQVMEYFEIFLGRMQMCRHAAEQLEARFRLTINGAELA